MSVKKRRFSHPSLDCTHWTAWIFLTVAKIQSEFVGGQIASWQLPPVSRRICQRQRIIPFEGKKNGGLEMSFKTADGESNLKIGARNYLPRSTVFFFPRTGQYLIVVLFLLKWQLSSQLNVCNITVQTDSYTMLRIFHVVPLTLRGCHAQEYHHVPCKGSCQHPES